MHNPLALLAIPPISTRRVDRSIKKSTIKRCNPFFVQTSTVKKSLPRSAPRGGSETPSTLSSGFAQGLGRCHAVSEYRQSCCVPAGIRDWQGLPECVDNPSFDFPLPFE